MRKRWAAFCLWRVRTYSFPCDWPMSSTSRPYPPPRWLVSLCRRFTSRPKVTSKRLSIGSGSFSRSRSKVFLSQWTYPLAGGCFFTTFFPAAAFPESFLFSITCSGAWATT